MRARITILCALFACLFLIPSISVHAEGKVSYKYLKKQLKKDSSETTNKKLAVEVLDKGVKFIYSPTRDTELRELGASGVLIRAIYTAVVEESDEKRLFRRFTKNNKSEKQDQRKTAYEAGVIYLRRFEKRARFLKRVNRIKTDLEVLGCEFDPDKGC